MLQYLVTHPARVITKDELLAAIWPHVVVTEDSLTHCIREVRSALGDLDQKMIKTVNKRGYLFAEPVNALDDERAADRTPAADVPGSVGVVRNKWSPRRWLALSGAILLALALGFVVLQRNRGSVAPRLSLVVLPFTNLSADPAQEYLADVITNDLTIALARLRGAMVIAPGSAMTLKGTRLEPRQLAAQLGVRCAAGQRAAKRRAAAHQCETGRHAQFVHAMVGPVRRATRRPDADPGRDRRAPGQCAGCRTGPGRQPSIAAARRGQP